MAGPYPNSQMNPAAAIPVWIAPNPNGGVAAPGAPYIATPLGYQQITALTAAVHLTPPAGATFAAISVSGAAVRYRDDGTAPTATVGMPLAIGSTTTYAGPLAVVEFIGEAAGAILDISYYK
jgi:hypothetical protein